MVHFTRSLIVSRLLLIVRFFGVCAHVGDDSTNCMEFNRPRPGDTNQFYIAGETFMQRSLAYVSPIVEVTNRMNTFPPQPCSATV